MRGIFVAVACVALASCKSGSEASAARDRARAEPGWALTLEGAGAPLRIPLISMDVWLIKDAGVAAVTPTPFTIEGEGLFLLGQIPPAANPDYEEDWKKLIGVPLALGPRTEAHGDGDASQLTLADGTSVLVVGGWMTARSISGKWAGSKGDRTLKGTITLRLQDGRTLDGTFAVHVITWG